MARWKIAALTLLTTTTALAGPLTPPAGAPAPTNKTLQEVEPRTPLAELGATIVINQPGSYYLTEDIDSNFTAITIQTGGVTIDLNGFSIIGSNAGPATEAGVRITAAGNDRPIVIKNGSIESFAGPGVASTTAVPVALENVHFQDCLRGADLLGPATITSCSARDCDQTGFHTASVTLIRDCLSQNNADGFIIETGLIEGCVAENNILFGFIANQPAEISGCLARLNGRSGFLVNIRGLVTNCVANQNGEDGFTLGVRCRIYNCHASTNGATDAFAGIQASANCTIDTNTVADNRNGVIAGTGSLVIRNTATGNALANYDVAGSSRGPIINPGGLITSTNPWANFEH